MRFVLSFLLLVNAGDSLQKDIDLVAKQGRGTAEGRAAWERVAEAKADALPLLLDAMNSSDTVTANWLRTAFDRIVERELKAGAKINVTKLLDFVNNPKNNGRTRRYAMELVERLEPGLRDKLRVDWLDDPEFRYDAVAFALDKAKNAAKAGNSLIAVNLYRQAFDKSRDMMQAREAALGLQEGGIQVSVAEHLGFITDWHLIGPFDGKGQKGGQFTYPPEKKVDLAEELDGQKGKVRWKRFQVKETPPTSKDRHQALVNLASREALGNADDAVAFAYAELVVDGAMKAEMRGAADDHFVVYVNGTKVFAFEEWRNGVRHDRHRFPVELKAGTNAVLVKISQSAAPNPEPNWEFMLRVVDATGKGISIHRQRTK